MAKVKGMMFTLGLTLFALLILTLSALIFNVFESTKDIGNEGLALDSLYEIDMSIQNSFNKIIEKKSGINFDIKDDEIMINETLPNLNADDFKNETLKFRQFLDSEFPDASFDSILMEEAPITIRPYDIVYTHNKFGDNRITISYISNISSYEIYFFNENTNSTVEWLDFDPGNVDFTIVYESGSKDTKSHKINPAGESKARIKLDSGNLDIEIKNNEIRIDNNSNTNVVIRTTIILIEKAVKRIVFADVLTLTLNQYGIIKRGDINLL